MRPESRAGSRTRHAGCQCRLPARHCIDRAGVPSYVTSPDGFAEVVHEGGVDRGVSATLTFWPSEFSQIRGQLRRTHYGIIDRTYNELLLQLQFAIGAHGAHTF